MKRNIGMMKPCMLKTILSGSNETKFSKEQKRPSIKSNNYNNALTYSIFS